jgi:hypothetical protein
VVDRQGNGKSCFVWPLTRISTTTLYAYERIEAGKAMPGVFETSRTAPIGPVIEDILLLIECSLEGEWEGQIIYLPLK